MLSNSVLFPLPENKRQNKWQPRVSQKWALALRDEDIPGFDFSCT
jgi:hypothetical protein